VFLTALTCGTLTPRPVHADFEDHVFEFMHAVLQMMPQFVDAPRPFRELSDLLEQMLRMVGHHGPGRWGGPPPWARGHMGRGMAIAHHAGCMGPGGGRFDFGGRGGGDCGLPRGDGMFGGRGEGGGRFGAGMNACVREGHGPGIAKKAGDPAVQPGCAQGPRFKQGMNLIMDHQGKCAPFKQNGGGNPVQVANQPKNGGVFGGKNGGAQPAQVPTPMQPKNAVMIGGKAGQGRGPMNLNNAVVAQGPQGQVKGAVVRPMGNAKAAPVNPILAHPKNLALARPVLNPGNGFQAHALQANAMKGMVKNQPALLQGMQGKGPQPQRVLGMAKVQPVAFTNNGQQPVRGGMAKTTVFGQGARQPGFGGVAKPVAMPRPNQPQVINGMVRPMGLANNFQGPRGIAKPMVMPQQAQRPASTPQQPKAMPQINRTPPMAAAIPNRPQSMPALAKPQPRPMHNVGDINMAMRFSPVAMQRGPTQLTAARGVGGMMGGPAFGPRRR
jgi:hypothetical protein